MPSNNFGSKANNLLWLQENIGSIPNFILLDPKTFIADFEILQEKINSILIDNSPELVQKISNIILESKTIPNEIEKALKSINDLGFPVIIRTSATIEDLRKTSFAGMYYSSTPLDKIDLVQEIKKCWLSLYSEKVLNYSKSINLSIEGNSFFCIVQKFYEAEIYGVAFVDSSKNLVQLSLTNESHDAIVEGKNSEYIESTLTEFNSNLIKNYSPNLNTIDNLKQSFNQIAKLKHKAQDIEFGLSQDSFALFQTRDITKLVAPQLEIIWDNTNISESYPGITLPLTYSFIRNAYANVYPSFLAYIGIPKNKLSTYDSVFGNMLGHIQGRVYYNVNNWYKLVSLLPGYKYNKEFFENMWNPASKDKNQTKAKVSLIQKLFFIPLLVKFIFKLLLAPISIKKFKQRFNLKYDLYSKRDLNLLNSQELAEHYLNIENTFFKAWAVPILNDFRVMIFFGIHTKITNLLFKDNTEFNSLDLILGKKMFLSLEPMIALKEMAIYIDKNAGLKSILNGTDSVKMIYDTITSKDVKLSKMINKYIATYGDRCPAELKLESKNFKENPELLIYILKSYSLNESFEVTPEHPLKESDIKKKNDPRLSHLLVRLTGTIASKAIIARENLRMMRSEAYGLARIVFNRFGYIFTEQGIIKEATDIFYLTREEILSIANGHYSFQEIDSTIRIRKLRYIKYFNSPDLPRRFNTKGIPNFFEITPSTQTNNNTNHFSGLAASPGISRGEVLCLKYFDPLADYKNKILVVPQTDPGWTLVFPALSGLVTERGNILSHAAIVSRELNIPSVVAIEGITEILKNGMTVEVNGNNGKVTIL